MSVFVSYLHQDRNLYRIMVNKKIWNVIERANIIVYEPHYFDTNFEPELARYTYSGGVFEPRFCYGELKAYQWIKRTPGVKPQLKVHTFPSSYEIHGNTSRFNLHDFVPAKHYGTLRKFDVYFKALFST